MRTGALETQMSMDQAMENAPEWADRALGFLRNFPAGMDFTAEDLRSVMGDPPGLGNVIGAVFRTARRSGLIRCTGFTTSTRPDAHGRVLRIWQRTDGRGER